MTSEYFVKDYYKLFIDNAKKDIDIYQEEINKLTDNINTIYTDILVPNKDNLKEHFNIDFDRYECELINKEYNPNKTLYKFINKAIKFNWDKDKRDLLYKVLSYCIMINNRHDYEELIKINKERTSITLKEFKHIVETYYLKTHEILLNGDRYKYGYGIGEILIKYIIPRKTVMIVDSQATEKNRRRLIDEGRIPFNKDDFERCKKLGKEYKGESYTVIKNIDSYYRVCIQRSNLRSCKLELQVLNKCSKNYKGKSYAQIAEQVKNMETIIKESMDIKSKLSILNLMFPALYLKFVRNVDRR